MLEAVGYPLKLVEWELPRPGLGQMLVEVAACAVCRTDLHVIDGHLPQPKLPLIPGHEIVGRVTRLGDGDGRFAVADRVGIPWVGSTCGTCGYCRSGRENLCDAPGFTGYQIDGGYATHAVADARYCFRIPSAYDDVHATQLLCAGLIGYRSFKAAGHARRLAIFGFGAAAHMVAQIARHAGQRVFALTRPGDDQAQEFARSVGCEWAGGSDETPPEPSDAAIIFAPVGDLVPIALKQLVKGRHARPRRYPHGPDSLHALPSTSRLSRIRSTRPTRSCRGYVKATSLERRFWCRMRSHRAIREQAALIPMISPPWRPAAVSIRYLTGASG